MKKFLQTIALAGFAAVLAACGNSGDSDTKEIQAAAESMVRGFVEGDADKVLDVGYFGGQKPTAEERTQFKMMLNIMGQAIRSEMEKKGGLKSVKVEDVKVNGDTATANVVVIAGNGTNKKPAKFFKEDGKWKISLD